MTLGTGIFLSALLFCLFGLYAATKDRWNWRRIAIRTIGGLFGVGLAIGLCIWFYSIQANKPKAQFEFFGIKLGSVRSDVRFLKGNPTAEWDDGDWVYYQPDPISRNNISAHVIRWKNDRVRYVLYGTSSAQTIHPWLQGITIGTSYDQVIEILGTPGHMSNMANGLERMLSYPQFNTFYAFEKGSVNQFGIYDPTGGPMEYVSSASTNTPPASSASK